MEWLLLVTIILAVYLVYRGFLRGDPGIPDPKALVIVSE